MRFKKGDWVLNPLYEYVDGKRVSYGYKFTDEKCYVYNSAIVNKKEAIKLKIPNDRAKKRWFLVDETIKGLDVENFHQDLERLIGT